VESFHPEPVTIKVIINGPVTTITDLLTGQAIQCIPGTSPHVWGREGMTTSGFEITLKPHSYKVFQKK